MSLSMFYNIDVDTNRKLVTAKIYGIWKAETAHNYHKDYVVAAQPLLGGRWGKLTILTNWKSSYPEIINIIGDHMQWSLENGAALSIYVIDNPVTMRQLKQMIEKGAAVDITKLYRTIGEAEKCLKENGF
ncbi:MAG: hypothetical protein AB1746_15470 [Candidatus Zixiibacteriota bacterium]